jgi:hypothetical protein
MNAYETPNLGQQTVNLAEIFLQESARLLEHQAALARAVMRTQARGFAALGAPDWSSLYTHENERQFSEFVKTSTDQALSFMRQTNEKVRQFQQALNQIVSQQTSKVTAQIRTSAEEIGQGTHQVQQQLRQGAHQTPQQARTAVEEAWQGSGANELARSTHPA